MSDNPFEIIGIAPRMLSRLMHKEIISLMRDIVRAQQKRVHPDVTSKEVLHARSVRINDALHVLENCDRKELEVWKEQFVKKTPMTKRLKKTEGKLHACHERLVRSGMIMADLFAQKLETAISHEAMAQLCIYNPWVTSLGAQQRTAHIDVNFLFFNMIIDTMCNMTSYDDSSIEIGTKAIVGSIDEGVYQNGVSRDIKDFYNGDDLKRRQGIAGQKLRQTGKTIYRGPRITAEHFYLIADNIRPGVYDHGYIVSVNRAYDGNIFFQIEGSVKTCTSLIAEKEMIEA